MFAYNPSTIRAKDKKITWYSCCQPSSISKEMVSKKIIHRAIEQEHQKSFSIPICKHGCLHTYIHTIHTHTHTREREGGKREGRKEWREKEWRERDIGREEEKQGHDNDIYLKLGDKCVKDKCEDLNLMDIASIKKEQEGRMLGWFWGKVGEFCYWWNFIVWGHTETLEGP